MKFSPRPLVVRRLVALFVGFGFWGTACLAPARAADAVRLEIASPFERTPKPLTVQVKFARWFPVGVTLTNTGDAVNGRLTLQLTSSGGPVGQRQRAIVAHADVDLPTNARKRVWLYGRADGVEWDGAVVRFAARGLKTLEAPFGLESTDIGTRVVVTVGDAGEKLSYLSGFKDRRLSNLKELQAENPDGANYGNMPQPANAQGYVRPLGASHEMVPDRWIGLEAADAVVLQDFAHTSLTPPQVAALRGYVAGGGTLVVPAGANWQRLAQSPLADLWPVTPTGSGSATTTETAEIVRRYVTGNRLSGADRLGGAPVVLTRGPLRPGAQKWAGVGATPLLASRAAGAGAVLWLAMDPTKPPFIGWSGHSALWVELFDHGPRTVRLESVDSSLRLGFQPNAYRYNLNGAGSDATGSILQVIKALPQLQMPPTSVIAWFLSLYVFILVPVNYFVLRYFDRRELAWITVPAIAVAFSVMSYGAARSIKGTELLARHVNIVQGDGSGGLARADSMLWIRSPRKASYRVASSNPQMAMTDYLTNSDGSSSADLSLQQPDASRSFHIENVSVPMWSQAQFVGQSVVESGQGIQLLENSGVLSVRNRTPFRLAGAVLVANGRVLRCGKNGVLEAGATGPTGDVDGTTVGGPQLVGRIENASGIAKLFAPEGGQATTDSTLRDLAHSALVATIGTSRSANAAPILIGWSREAAAPLALQDEEPRLQNVSLFIYQLPSLSSSMVRLLALQNGKKARLGAVPTAMVERKEVELIDLNRAQASGRREVYECRFHEESLSGTAVSPVNIRIALSGSSTNFDGATGETPYYGSYSIKKNKTLMPPVVQVQVWDFDSDVWLTLRGTLVPPSKDNREWSYSATLPQGKLASYMRRPDNVLRLRTLTAHGWVKINEFEVTAQS